MACRQDDGQNGPQRAEQPMEQRLIALSAQAFSLPFSEEEQSARTVSFDLGTKGAMTDPKFKDLSAGTKFLCIIRSSNPAQPINYVEMTWKRDAGNSKKYYIEQTDGPFTVKFTSGQPLGQLSMMIVVGGSWNATTKRLSFSPQISKITTSGGREVATLDVPYFSEWKPLDIENDAPEALKIKLQGYKQGSTPEPAFTLQPQGMLLRMRVENEMLALDGKTRDLTLSKLYLRSTAYAGGGYYDLSETAVRTGVNKTAETRNAQLLPWVFSDTRSYKETTFDLSSSPLSLPYDGTGRTAYNRFGIDGRTFYNYPNSPWLLCWVKPTGQSGQDVGQNDGSRSRVRTEMLAEVEDTRANTVYSNVEGVDKLEAAGRIVVPSMKALPVYASRKLTIKNGQNAGFVNGAAYTLTLNLQRTPMALDLLSEEAVKQDGKSFDEGDYTNVGYFRASSLTTESGIQQTLPITTTTDWRYPKFQMLATIMGTTKANSNPAMNLDDLRARGKAVDGIGTYAAEEGYSVRSAQAFSYQLDSEGRIIVYSLLFYPPRNDGSTLPLADRLNASHLSVTRYEYAGMHGGVPRMKITQRYLGSYSLDAGHLDERFNRADLTNRMLNELDLLVRNSDDFWNDALKKKDDVVRYFPLLGYKASSNGMQEKYGVMGTISLGSMSTLTAQGSGEYTTSALQHNPSTQSEFQYNNWDCPIRLVRPSFK